MPNSHPTRYAPRLALALLAAALVPAAVARGDATSDVSDAIDKLDAAGSYTWAVHAEHGGGRDATGKVDNRAGWMSIATTANHKPVASIVHGFAQYVHTDAGWKQIDDAYAEPNGIDLVKSVNIYQTPIVMVRDQVEHVPTFVRTPDGTLVGDLTPKAVASGLNPPPDGTTYADARGTVTVTLTNGVVSRIVTRYTATATGNGPARPFERTFTVTITDVDHTTPDVPPEAKAAVPK